MNSLIKAQKGERKFHQQDIVYNPKIDTPLLPAGTHGSTPHLMKINDKTKIRRLTPTECERLQGFPDNWTVGFSDTQRYKMMGNAVTVNVIKAIGEKLNGK